MNKKEIEKITIARAALNEAALQLEQLCPVGSESAVLLRQSEAEAAAHVASGRRNDQANPPTALNQT
jgi:hypothetical protein